MTRNVLIVEDNLHYREHLRKIVEELSLSIHVICADTVEMAYQAMANSRIHVFILDIILDNKISGDVSGLNLADYIRSIEKYRSTPIIFITSLEDPKLYTLSQLHCFDYIEKPFSVPRVRDTLLSALRIPIIEDEKRNIFFRKDGILYAKRIEEIVYIENSHRRMNIFCINDCLVIPYRTMNEIIRQIDSELFVNCSRFVHINRMHIEYIDYRNRYIKMKYYDEPIEIGRKMLETFRRKMEND